MFFSNKKPLISQRSSKAFFLNTTTSLLPIVFLLRFKVLHEGEIIPAGR